MRRFPTRRAPRLALAAAALALLAATPASSSEDETDPDFVVAWRTADDLCVPECDPERYSCPCLIYLDLD